MVLKVSELDQKMAQSHTVLLRIEIFITFRKISILNSTPPSVELSFPPFIVHVTCMLSIKTETFLHHFQQITNITI